VQRQALVGQLQSLLRDLGLERKARELPDLAGYIAEKRKQNAESETLPAMDARCATTDSTPGTKTAPKSTQHAQG